MTDIIIIGAGPAGLTAALYAARAGKSVLVLEKESVGGQIIYSPMVDNYPAAPHISGNEFAQRLSQQVLALNADLETEEVLSVEPFKGGFRVQTDFGEHESRAVILATGVKHRRLGLPGEDELTGMGVSYCAICDGAFFNGRDVAVVGGGDTALQDALFLANGCRRVTVIHRRDELRGEARLAALLRDRANVRFLLSHTVEALCQSKGELTGLTLRDLKSGATVDFKTDGLFVAVGQEPQSAIFAGLGLTDQDGYFQAGEDGQTPIPGLLTAGDCRKKSVRQLTTAVGDGAVAGLAASRYIDSLR